MLQQQQQQQQQKCIICSSHKFQQILKDENNINLGLKNKYKTICNDTCMSTWSIYYDRKSQYN